MMNDDLEVAREARLLKWKDFFQQHRKAIIVSVLAVILSLGSWLAWQYWQDKQNRAAAMLYQEFDRVFNENDKDKILQIAKDFRERYPRTFYARLAVLRTATSLSHRGSYDETKEQLTWFIKDNPFPEIAPLGPLHLSAILLDEGKSEEALQLMKGKPLGYEVLFAERRGDILAMQGKDKEACEEYKDALSLTQDDTEKQIFNLKLDRVCHS